MEYYNAKQNKYQIVYPIKKDMIWDLEKIHGNCLQNIYNLLVIFAKIDKYFKKILLILFTKQEVCVIMLLSQSIIG